MSEQGIPLPGKYGPLNDRLDFVERLVNACISSVEKYASRVDALEAKSGIMEKAGNECYAEYLERCDAIEDAIEAMRQELNKHSRCEHRHQYVVGRATKMLKGEWADAFALACPDCDWHKVVPVADLTTAQRALAVQQNHKVPPEA